jgi:hypothetical protein
LFGANVTATEICIFAWAILGMIEVAILLRVGDARLNAEEKFLIDVGLIAMIIAIWFVSASKRVRQRQ